MLDAGADGAGEGRAPRRSRVAGLRLWASRRKGFRPADQRDLVGELAGAPYGEAESGA
jgi:hypothetical protein